MVEYPHDCRSTHHSTRHQIGDRAFCASAQRPQAAPERLELGTSAMIMGCDVRSGRCAMVDVTWDSKHIPSMGRINDNDNGDLMEFDGI